MSMGEIRVTSPLLGTVIAVHATVGSAVAAGKDLIVIESMKMEIPVISEVAGKIVRLAVTQGDVVQEGDLIIEIG